MFSEEKDVAHTHEEQANQQKANAQPEFWAPASWLVNRRENPLRRRHKSCSASYAERSLLSTASHGFRFPKLADHYHSGSVASRFMATCVRVLATCVCVFVGQNFQHLQLLGPGMLLYLNCLIQHLECFRICWLEPSMNRVLLVYEKNHFESLY